MNIILPIQASKKRCGIAVLLAALLSCSSVLAQDKTEAGNNSAAAASAQATIQELKEKVAAAELADEQKQSFTDTLETASKRFGESSKKAQQEAQFSQQLQNVEQATNEAELERDELATFAPDPAPEKPLSELEGLLTKANTAVDNAETELRTADQNLSAATQRRTQIEKDTPGLEKQMSELSTQVGVAEDNPDGTLSNRVALVSANASLKLLKATLAANQAEAALIEARTTAGYFRVLRDLKAARLENAKAQQQIFQTAVTQARAEEANARVKTAADDLDVIHPALRPIAERNQQLAEQTKLLTIQIEKITAELELRKQKKAEILDDLESAKNRVTQVGLTDAVGSQLRAMKQKLPDATTYRLSWNRRQSLIDDEQLKLMELQDERKEDPKLFVSRLFRNQAVVAGERNQLALMANEKISTQRSGYLDPAITSQQKYFDMLVSLSTTEQQIVQNIEEATLFANERILWIRSSTPLYSNAIPASKEWWFLLPAAWSEVFNRVIVEIKSNAAVWILAFIALVILMRLRSNLRDEISEIGAAVRRSTSVRIGPTMRSLVLTLSASLPVAASLMFLGWRLRYCAGGDTVLRSLSAACGMTAATYFPAEFLRQVCRPNGIGEAHFGWSASALRRLKNGLQWLLPTLAPLVFATTFLNAGNDSVSSDVLERCVFVVVVLVVLVFLCRVLHPRTGLPAEYLATHPDGWFNRTTFAWYPASLAALVAFVLLPIAGYYFTSQQLAWKAWLSLMLLFTVVMLVSIIKRWVMVRRRQLRIEEIKRKREAEPPVEGDLVAAVSVDETSPEVLREQTQQVERLLGSLVVVSVIVGAFLIWVDVLPALDFLDQWPIWMSTTTITETVPGEDGKLISSTRQIPDPTTISDLVLAILILALTFGAARNLPGLLEFSLLRRLPLDRSVRYAITTLASYGIAIIGIVTAGQTIGLHWQQLQYVATALTFGLAFGLQETFANFVAGIIILFEQPVRVGDVVEIDGVTGVVSRIRIRATTISNWDRKDYIVPNKEFITGKLLNWTRTDDVSRIVIPVGIAYGSDVDQARQLLLSIAKDHANTLEDPSPSATFEAFGDNALTLTLRTFVGRIDQRLETIHELHTSIGKAFENAKIDISFPQRDLNLRSLPSTLEKALQHLTGGRK